VRQRVIVKSGGETASLPTPTIVKVDSKPGDVVGFDLLARHGEPPAKHSCRSRRPP
jgi:hypothetical protein